MDIAETTQLGERRSMDENAFVARNLPRLAVQNYASGDSDEEESSNKNSVVDRRPILQFVRGPHRTIVETSQLDEDHGEVAEDESHAEAQTNQSPWMAKAQYQYWEGTKTVGPLFVGPVLSTVDSTNFLSRNAITIFDSLEGLKAVQSLYAMPSRSSTAWRA